LWNFRGPLLKRFHRQGYRVLAVAPKQGIDPAVFRQAGVEFIDWPVKRAALGAASDLVHVYALWRLLRQQKPDILFAHTIKPVIYGMFLGWIAGVPRRVAMIPGLGFAFIKGRSLKRTVSSLVARIGYRVSLPRASLVVVQNRDDRQALIDFGALPRSMPVAVVNGSGVDMTHFSPQPLPPGPVTFLMVARLLIDKGVMEFVEAARIVTSQHRDIRFVLVGSADENPTAVPPDTLRAWREDGPVEVCGFMADPRPAYAACHVYVLPSYREGTPRTTLEAMATGRAIITTDAAGCRETVEHGVNGLLVPVRNAPALAAAMIELAADPVRIQAMGRASLEMCRERYELGDVTESTARLIAGQALTVQRDAM